MAHSPFDYYAAIAVAINLIWTATCAGIIAAHGACAEECWLDLIVLVYWLRGEALLAPLSILAAGYSTFSWLKWRTWLSVLALCLCAAEVTLVVIAAVVLNGS